MADEKENDINATTTKNKKQSLSETTIRKVFFSTPAPSCLFSPTVITAKGLYPPSIIIVKALLKNTIPTKSHSMPIKLITMKEHPPEKENKGNLKKSSSTPTSIKKPTLIERLISPTKSETSTIRKAPRPSTSARSAPIQTKTNRSSINFGYKKKKPPKLDEDDEPMTKPISLTEKRKRQAKRADQVKSWKVREEREAREARLVIRRQLVNGISKAKPTESTATPKKKKKRVKFNFDRNSIIQLPALLDNEDVT